MKTSVSEFLAAAKDAVASQSCHTALHRLKYVHQYLCDGYSKLSPAEKFQMEALLNALNIITGDEEVEQYQPLPLSEVL